ncbi:MAG: DHA2 family efflux MFS transporter permease subunit [Arcanobacterium sp.]|nr:DHA2 family efflux MFS transporter permease subunit [Arcanobacterium sp.]
MKQHDKDGNSQAANRSVAPKQWGFILALYLLGIFMGALDTGIVTPARTVIQNSLGVNETTGIWMITIYTLAYAAAIPVMGKLADRFGRKPLYIVAIALFGIGSFGCGIAQDMGSFPMLLVARVVQAIGGGGIVPIATAAVGVFVPREKQGMALGLVGGVYGIANVFGASAGSLILGIVGNANWQWIFYVNVPIAIFVVAAGVWALPHEEPAAAKPIDYLGITLMVLITTSLLWAIQHFDFFAIAQSFQDRNVIDALLTVLVMTPIFVWWESKAKDPVIDFHYFAKRTVAFTLLLAALSGVVLMAIVFVPQFAENSMRLPTGSGGYPVIILGLASGVGAPMSGRLTDKYGPRAVIGIGVVISLVAAAVLLLWAVPQPGYAPTIVALILQGLGLGFLVGAPLNYLMMHLLPQTQVTTGLANLSLVRSFGTTIAPAILVGLLANSLGGMQNTLMDQMPKQVQIAALPHAQELQDRLTAMKADPQLASQLENFQLPDLTKTTFPVNLGGSGSNDAGAKLPAALTDSLRTADVTNIVARSVQVANYEFDQQMPKQVESVQSGIARGLTGLESGKKQMDGAIAGMQARGLPPMAYAKLATSRDQMAETITWMQELNAAVPGAFEQGRENYMKEIRAHGAQLERTFQLELNKGFSNIFWFYGAAALAMLLLLLGVPRRKDLVTGAETAVVGDGRGGFVI